MSGLLEHPHDPEELDRLTPSALDFFIVDIGASAGGLWVCHATTMYCHAFCSARSGCPRARKSLMGWLIGQTLS
ncbi:MAG: hypothetical protein ABIR35_08055 [Polaromonas sp.]